MFHGPIEAALQAPAAPAGPRSPAVALLGAAVLVVLVPLLAVRLFAWALARTCMKPVRLAALCGECVLEARRTR